MVYFTASVLYHFNIALIVQSSAQGAQGRINTKREDGRFLVNSFSTIGHIIYLFYIVRCTTSKST